MTATSGTRRTAEAAAMLAIGDGVLGLARPAEHCLIWRAGPPWWRRAVDWFAGHPNVTRTVAAIEVCAGLWLALRSQQDLSPDPGGADVISLPA
jgi:hypothetical protein